MAIIVEDGTGKADAEAYATVAEYKTRHTALGNAEAVALSDSVIEQNLRKSTEAMLQRFRSSWKGYRVLSTQALDFPRYGVEVDGFELDSNVVPKEVKNANIDLAWKAEGQELNPDKERTVLKKKTGPLSTEWDVASPENTRFSSIDDMLRPLLMGGGSRNSIKAVVV